MRHVRHRWSAAQPIDTRERPALQLRQRPRGSAATPWVTSIWPRCRAPNGGAKWWSCSTIGPGSTRLSSASAVAAEKDLAGAAKDPTLGGRRPPFGSDPPGGPRRRVRRRPAAARHRGSRCADARRPDRRALPRRSSASSGSVPRTDFSEIVRRALVGTLSAQIGDALPGLFEADARDVQRAAAALGRPDAFSRAARAFFGRLLADTLGYWLDRTLSAEIGPGARIESVGERKPSTGPSSSTARRPPGSSASSREPGTARRSSAKGRYPGTGRPPTLRSR